MRKYVIMGVQGSGKGTQQAIRAALALPVATTDPAIHNRRCARPRQ